MASGDDVSTRTRGISLGLNPNFTSQIALLLLTPQLPPIVRAPPASQSAPSPSRLRCLRPALSSRTPCEPEPSCFFPPPERRARPSAWRMRTMSCQAYLKGSRRNAVAGGLGGGISLSQRLSLVASSLFLIFSKARGVSLYFDRIKGSSRRPSQSALQ